MNKIKLKLKQLKAKQLKRGRGSGMIEILIATGVVGVVMTAIVSGFVLSVKSTSFGKNRILATSKAQQALEVFRRERFLLGWGQFSNSVSAGTYCLSDLPSDSAAFKTMQLGACAEDEVVGETIFIREAIVSLVPDEEVRVEIVVTWPEGNKNPPPAVSLVQELRKYD